MEFKDINDIKPIRLLEEHYHNALNRKQDNIEAIVISSLDSKTNHVDARFVNLKFIHGDKFIFFSNYNSPKSTQFISNPNITAVIFWSKINLQVRIRGVIDKIPSRDSDTYFRSRDLKKNALSISSNQSKKIDSYNKVQKKYNDVLESNDLGIRPKYWGGFFFRPNYFEFWEGKKHRLNKRTVYLKGKKIWSKFYLEP